MVRSWKFFGEAKRRWDYLWIMPIRSLPTAMRLRHLGRVLPLSPQQRRGPLILTGGRPRREIRPYSRGTASILSQLERDTMSMSNQAVQSHSIKDDHNGTMGPPFRPGRKGRQQPRKIRVAVSLPSDLVDRLRDAVYWSPGLTLAWLIGQSLRTSLAEMESLRHGPFPKRTNALRAGRPRLVGQIMKVFIRARATGIGTEPLAHSQTIPGVG
jgi:hypothetical protein